MSAGHTILFAGPSLPPHLSCPCNMRIRPPARCGDLLRALHEAPAAIALVDGIFETGRTVWHKELLAVMAAGVRVYGAASLGALRAAELDGFGMIGVGAIYDAYRDGRLDSDAAVMVLHAPPELGGRALTLPLVDADASIAATPLPPIVRRRLHAIAARLNFRERSWATILDGYGRHADPVSTRDAADAIAAAAFSQKERDVVRLLARIAEDAGRSDAPPRYAVPQTSFFRALLAEVATEAH